MKRKWLLGLVVMICGLLVAGGAIASPQYNMLTVPTSPTNGFAGQIYTGAGAVDRMNTDSATAGVPPFGISAGMDMAGWWTFAVTSSTGSNWNDVFAGGVWNYEIKWNGSVNIPGAQAPGQMSEASFRQSATWADMYGKWFKNNDYVYTYFKLYVDPSSGGASTPGTAPIGVFAFVADSQHVNFAAADVDALFRLGDVYVNAGGIGVATASSVPIPGALLLFAPGLACLGLLRRRFMK